MIFRIREIVFVLLVVLLPFTSVYGQQDAMNTQYNFNTQTINPAYAGTWESLGFIAMVRHQWVGFDGAPKTYTLSVQSLLRNEKVGLGLNLIGDKIGREKRFNVSGDYSYRVQIDRKSYVRLGLKVGFSTYQNNLFDYQQYPDQDDPASQGVVDSDFTSNFGLGALLVSDNYYVGISVPRLLENDYEIASTNNSIAAEQRHYFLIGGYVFDFSPSVKFKPTFLGKATMGAPVQFDFSANFLFREKFWFGAMYRTGDSFGVIAQWIFDRKLRIGYSFDFTTSNLQSYNNGTHEVMFSYEIGFRKKWSTPRRF